MRTLARLTAARVKQLMRERKPGLVADGGNLYLQDGSSWLFKYERAGVRRPAALGRGQRRPAVVSFQDFAEQHIASHAPGWRAGGKSESQWRSSLAAYVYPVIGGMAVGAVDLNDVLRVLTPIWTAKAVTAGRVRGRVESILDAAFTRPADRREPRSLVRPSRESAASGDEDAQRQALCGHPLRRRPGAHGRTSAERKRVYANAQRRPCEE
jgi:hypothetical protein